jgi:hypothetical protein
MAASRPTIPALACDFASNMRKLWQDHIIWTHLYVITAAANLPDKELVTQRLLRNQVDIGDAIRPFYGPQAGDTLTQLLKDHILLAAAIIDDVKSNNTAKLNQDNTKWYANANAIATFLSNANPENLPLAEIQAMMKMHLDLLKKDVLDRIGGNYAEDVKAVDVIHQQILDMADTISVAIIRQFQEKFV